MAAWSQQPFRKVKGSAADMGCVGAGFVVVSGSCVKGGIFRGAFPAESRQTGYEFVNFGQDLVGSAGPRRRNVLTGVDERRLGHTQAQSAEEFYGGQERVVAPMKVAQTIEALDAQGKENEEPVD